MNGPSMCPSLTDRPLEVLVVDDEPAILDISKEFLEEFHGMKVTAVGGGKEALDVLSNRRFDAVVSDYQMPVMDGLLLLKELRSRDFDIPFILFTGRGREEDQISPQQQEELLRQIDWLRQGRSLEVQVTCAPQYARIAAQGNGTAGAGVAGARGRRPGGCLAGRSFVFISRKGEVYPCGYFPLSAGSIREKNFIEIWQNSPLLLALRERALTGRCGRCPHSAICGGCRARAYADSGDFLGQDPSCLLEAGQF